ncbi:hypothetical protein [Paenibacillus xylanexedens]|uniref:hypothetical protein n=1 Tax=Paenibacillus xylanexedens TaxID=528191 RepID=UPI0011A3C0ED|nr:hypothetical protein [Paenibacillus xylanexedens]
MARTSRVCSYCEKPMGADEFKCKSCGNLVATKTAQPERSHMTEDYNPILDRYSIVLLVIITIFFPPIAIIIGGVMLFSDHPYKKDTGKLLVTSAIVFMIVFIFIFIGTGTLTISL